jgi:hypothetical protein
LDDDLRDLLLTLRPADREHLRDVLIRDAADRDATSSMLMRYRDQNGQDGADIIDFRRCGRNARWAGCKGFRRDGGFRRLTLSVWGCRCPVCRATDATMMYSDVRRPVVPCSWSLSRG